MAEVSTLSTSMQQLPPSTVRLLASSQVITGVSSVIKELIENSLDAGATIIDVKLENFGFDKIEVRDNGTGIKAGDAPYMAQAHYTSKIAHTADLEQLLTYGFRGEALGSLCAVAAVNITTKTCDDDISQTYQLNEKGQIIATKPSHLPQGTTVCATHLFKKLPVRKQYYNTTKKKKEEMKKVEDLVIAFGVICHNVRFTLRHNRELVWQKNVASGPQDVLLSVFGSSLMSQMDHYENENVDIKIKLEMYLPKSTAESHLSSRATSDRSFVFVNRRPVILKDVEKVLKSYYCKAVGCDPGRYPLSFVNIVLPPSDLDVNLDPNKMKVMLHNQNEVLAMVRDILEVQYGSVCDGRLSQDKKSQRSALTKESDNEKQEVPDSENNNQIEYQGNNSGVSDQRNDEAIQCLSDDEKSYEQKEAVLQRGTQLSFQQCLSALPVVQGGDQSTIVVHNQSYHTVVEEAGTSSIDTNIVEKNNCPTSTGPTEMASFDLMEDDLLFVDSQQSAQSSFLVRTNDQSANSKQCDTLGSTEQTNHAEESLDLALPELDFGSTKSTSNDFSKHKEDKQSSGDEDLKGDPILESFPDTEGKRISDSEEKTVKTKLSDLDNDDSVTTKGPCLARDVDNAWSRGAVLKDSSGQPVNPVQLFVPGAQSVVPPISHNAPSKSSSSDKKLEAAAALNQSTLFDLGSSQVIKRPSTAYIHFAKAIRPKVIAANPGATFQDIARILGEKWNELSEEDQKKYEKIMSRDTYSDKDQTNNIKQPILSKLDQATKRRKLSATGGSQACVLNMLSPKHGKNPAANKAQTPCPPGTKSVQVNFSLTRLKCCMKAKQPSSPERDSSRFKLIGPLKSHGVWLGLHDNHLVIFHPIRAQEMLILRRLSKTHALPTEKLDKPMILEPDLVGGHEAWQALGQVHKAQFQLPDPHTYYNDPRLLKNGFNIREVKDQSTGDMKVEVVGLTRCMNYFGLSDLREIVQTLAADPHVSLATCRPIKVQHFLQGEAVRMARQLPQRTSREDAYGLYEQVTKDLPPEVTTCFHNRPFLLPLYDLNDIPLSQELEQFSQTQETQMS